MEIFWFFLLQFRRAYDSAYNTDFLFLQGHKHSCNSTYNFSNSDSIANEIEP